LVSAAGAMAKGKQRRLSSGVLFGSPALPEVREIALQLVLGTRQDDPIFALLEIAAGQGVAKARLLVAWCPLMARPNQMLGV